MTQFVLHALSMDQRRSRPNDRLCQLIYDDMTMLLCRLFSFTEYIYLCGMLITATRDEGEIVAKRLNN